MIQRFVLETEKTKREMYVDEVSIGMRILPQNEIITSEAKQVN